MSKKQGGKKGKLALHWQILIGMFCGVIYGALAINFGWTSFTANWIAPFGEIFLRALKLIAVPLVLFTLVTGIAGLSDITQLGKMGFTTVLLYLFSTIVAITIGLVTVNIIKPWEGMSTELKDGLLGSFNEKAQANITNASSLKNEGPLSFMVDLFPDNILSAASNNGNMLQVIVFAVLFGIALVAVPKDKSVPVIAFFDGVSSVILKMVDFFMLYAPIGTFALIAGLLVDLVANSGADLSDLLFLLGRYGVTVIIGLLTMVFVVYPLLLKLFTKQKIGDFYKGIGSAQLLAFSTSSSAATLPVTIDCAKNNLKIKDEVAGFVLPLGATINMDGTSCYQAIAAVFIANVMGFDLTLTQQLGIILTATLASIGSAAVPGAGIVMLAIVLGQLKIPMEGIALILGVDRLLDMCRTVVNVTGDLSITTIINKRFKKG